MTHEDIFSAIRDYFRPVSLDIDLPVAYDNAPFTEPDDSAWLRLSIAPGSSEQVQFGSGGRFRTTGMVFVDIFVPLNGGDKEALVAADKIVEHFRARTADGVRFKTPSVSVLGRNSGDWHHTQVTIPFYADDIGT